MTKRMMDKDNPTSAPFMSLDRWCCWSKAQTFGLFALFTSTLLGLTIEMAAAQEASNISAKARYSIALRGFSIATAKIDLLASARDFSIDVDTRVSGLARLVASGSAKVISKGFVRGTGLRTEFFNLETLANEQRFNLGFQNNNAGNVVHIALEPTPVKNESRVKIRPSHKRNVIDPMSAFVIRTNKLDRSICQRTARVFTGLERYDLKFSFTAIEEAKSRKSPYKGMLVACNIRYVPISGHFGSSQMTRYMRDNERFTVWFAPLESGNMVIPYRVLIGTENGDLTMNLRKLEQND